MLFAAALGSECYAGIAFVSLWSGDRSLDLALARELARLTAGVTMAASAVQYSRLPAWQLRLQFFTSLAIYLGNSVWVLCSPLVF
jgi:hypothetical protein